MTQISNKTLALLILATLVVVVTATTIQLNGGVTGFATTDTGTVDLAIQDNLAIEVDTGNNSITFGTCTPNASSSFSVHTNDSTDQSNGQCDAAALSSNPQRIQVNNVGNVDAGVNVSGECAITDWLQESGTSGTSSDNDFQISTFGAGCASGEVSTWTSLGTSDVQACGNLTVGNSFWMPAQATIDSDTQTTQNCAGDSTNTITFTGYNIP